MSALDGIVRDDGPSSALLAFVADRAGLDARRDVIVDRGLGRPADVGGLSEGRTARHRPEPRLAGRPVAVPQGSARSARSPSTTSGRHSGSGRHDPRRATAIRPAVGTLAAVRISTVILPHERWADARATWLRAEELGLHAAYTYDHLSWRSFRDRPWFEAMTTLAAAAVATSTLRLGTLVTSPNFRHPVPLAKELLTLDDLSEGRLVVGIGSGGTGFDAGALGTPPWPAGGAVGPVRASSPPLLDRLLTTDETTWVGTYYSAHEVVRHPAPVASPRPPFVVSALGPRAMEVAAEFGQGWVTTGATPAATTRPPRPRWPASWPTWTRHWPPAGATGRRSSGSCWTASATSRRSSRSTPSSTWPGATGALGITELVVHWPIADSPFDRRSRTCSSGS